MTHHKKSYTFGSNQRNDTHWRWGHNSEILGNLLMNLKKQKMSKKWKNAWRYHHFRNAYQKLWSYSIQFLKYGAQGMKGQTDGQTEKGHIEVGAPNNKSCNDRNYFRALQSPISSGKCSILNWASKLILSKKNSCKN